MEIIPFESRYAQDFKRLNEAWLEEYFVIEPYDSELLSQCEETIIQPGGFIFFVRLDKEIIGTAAFIYKSKGVYELGKMAVDTTYQGHQYGQQLMHFLLRFCVKKQLVQANLVFKYSTKKMQSISTEK